MKTEVEPMGLNEAATQISIGGACVYPVQRGAHDDDFAPSPHWESMPDSVVDVICITYNQQDYIRQALDSFLMQETTFPFRVLAADDCSTDATPDILREYADCYPGKVVPILRKQNCGGPKNLRLTCQASHARYIALCEGDDWWTDSTKLQKQYDCLEADPKAAVCFCDAEIIASPGWYLEDYYEKDEQGRMLIPSGIPGFNAGIGVFTAPQYFNELEQAHTSTLFYRWDPSIPFLPSYDNLFAGDSCLLMMMLSRGYARYIPSAMTAYRKTDDNESTISFKSWASNARNLQIGNVEVCEYLRKWYARYGTSFRASLTIEGKMRLAMKHHLRQLLRERHVVGICKAVMRHPRAACLVLGHIVDARKRTRRTMSSKVAGGIAATVRYWTYARAKKDDRLWVATSFRKRGFLDNTSYFYEYLLDNDYTVDIVWLTEDPEVIDALAKRGRHAYWMGSREGRMLLKHATVAITDHFRRSDYSFSGFNRGTEVVQLWHGIGLKTMDGFVNTNVRGVRYNDDIIPDESDSVLMRFAKSVKAIFVEPWREMQERYLLFLVANEHDVTDEGGQWHVPREAMFVSGTPRDAHLLSVAAGETTPAMRDALERRSARSFRVLYAPTYRFGEDLERSLIDRLLVAAEDIDDYLERVDGELVVRLHPHTWRDYGDDLSLLAAAYPRIVVDDDADVYASLGIYDALVTDYSSLAVDYLLLDRPIVFYWPDHKEFLERENALRHDPERFSPGAQVSSWEDVLVALDAYRCDSRLDCGFRREVREYFFDASRNDTCNSERVATEIKRRLSQKRER